MIVLSIDSRDLDILFIDKIEFQKKILSKMATTPLQNHLNVLDTLTENLTITHQKIQENALKQTIRNLERLNEELQENVKEANKRHDTFKDKAIERVDTIIAICQKVALENVRLKMMLEDTFSAEWNKKNEKKKKKLSKSEQRMIVMNALRKDFLVEISKCKAKEDAEKKDDDNDCLKDMMKLVDNGSKGRVKLLTVYKIGNELSKMAYEQQQAFAKTMLIEGKPTKFDKKEPSTKQIYNRKTYHDYYIRFSKSIPFIGIKREAFFNIFTSWTSIRKNLLVWTDDTKDKTYLHEQLLSWNQQRPETENVKKSAVV